MNFKETKLNGAFVIEIEKLKDERGFFARAWCQDQFARHQLNSVWVQSNISANDRSGTLRGMHYQIPPYEEVKLVRCTRGAIFDVIIDLRMSSPTRGKWIGVELTEKNHTTLYVPEGFAHGFQTLNDQTEVMYQVSQSYRPEAERGVRFDDPAFTIAWPLEVRSISDKDRTWPDYDLATNPGIGA